MDEALPTCEAGLNQVDLFAGPHAHIDVACIYASDEQARTPLLSDHRISLDKSHEIT
jgi:hypothetical protein